MGKKMKAALEKVEPRVYGLREAVETVKQADQPSQMAINSEIDQNRVMAFALPLLILAISASSLFIALSRLVTSQRGQIGLAKALGYSDAQVAESEANIMILGESGTGKELIAKAQEAIDGGAKALLLDLSQVKYMSSAGLLALQTINAMLRGESTPDPEAGWQALHKLEAASQTAKASNLRLLNLQPRVDRALEMVGFKQFIQVYTDRDAALASF